MGVRTIMEQNKDVTAWGGVSAILGLVFGRMPTELQQQFLVIVVFPMLGWLGVYLLKSIVTPMAENVVKPLAIKLWNKFKNRKQLRSKDEA